MPEMDFEIPVNLLEITVKLTNGKLRAFDIESELAIDEEELSKHFMEQAGKYAWWASLAEVAKAHKEKMELELDKAEAKADKTVREQLEFDGIKSTEALVKSRIKLNDDYLEAMNNLIKAKKNASILDKVQKAFEHRKEMLISVGAHLRDNKEHSNDLRSLKAKAGEITNR